ncbi:MAG: DUF2760 domain-containing protein [Chthoniobacterales bacterium]
MIKPYLSVVAVLIIVLNALLLIPATSAYTVPIALLGLLLGLFVLILSFRAGAKATPPSIGAPAPVPATLPPPVTATNQAETEIVAFFALLQDKGRLVDFLMEDLTAFDDARVGAAARVVHQGCGEVLKEYFKITSVSEAEEGSQVVVPAGYAADQYRMIGKLAGNPPFTGKLVHKGWKTEYVKLPRSTKTDRLPAIAPAEVEIG